MAVTLIERLFNPDLSLVSVKPSLEDRERWKVEVAESNRKLREALEQGVERGPCTRNMADYDYNIDIKVSEVIRHPE